MKKILMMLLAALLVFSFAGCDDEETAEKKDKVVLVQPGVDFPVTEDHFTGDYARFQMQVLSDKSYSIVVTAVDADENVVTDVEFNVGTYASEDDMLENEAYIDDETSVGGVVNISSTAGSLFYGDDTEAGEGVAYFDIWSEEQRVFTIRAEILP